MSQLISTGMDGLDELLGGGIRDGACAVIQGLPGTGKTTIGLQFVYTGCMAGQPGVIVTFEQLPEQIYADAANFGWDLQELERRGLLNVICTSPDVFLDQLQDPEGMVDDLIREMGARRMLVDSVSHLVSVASEPAQLRSLIYSMMNGIKRARLSCMITKEIGNSAEAPIFFEEYMADAVLSVTFEMGDDLFRRRYIEVLKARGQKHAYGKHTLKLSDGGACVYPRKPVAPSLDRISDERVSTGVEGLDQMLRGGIRKGQTVLVAGSAGVGKTTLGLSFVNAAHANDEAAVYVSFEESPQALLSGADRFGMSLTQMQQEGRLSCLHLAPVHLRTDELIATVEAEVKRIGATRAVLDSVTDLAMAGQAPQRLRETAYIINSMFKQHGVTSLLITEVPELFAQGCITDHHISIIVDGIILMKYLEMESEIQRAVSVLKMRDCNHDKDIRRFSIQGNGICVHSRFEGAEGLMAGSARPVPVVLSVRSFTDIDEQHNQEMMQRFSRLYPRAEPVSISLPYDPDEALKSVIAALKAPTSPLSVAPLCLYWLPEILPLKRLLPLDDVLLPDELNQHMPELRDAGRGDHLYAVPALATCGVLMYRKDLLEEAGFDAPPQTWDELIHQARTIITARGDQQLIGYQFPGYTYEGLTTSFLQNLWSNGAGLYDRDRPAIEDEPTLQVLNYMHGLIHREALVPADVTTMAGGLEPQADFLAGRTVFLTMLPSVAQAAHRLDSPVRDRIGIAPPPCGPGGTESITYLSGWLYSIPSGARAPEAAGEFIRFMTGAQVQKERALHGGPLPTIESLYSDPEVLALNPDYPAIRRMLRTARSRADIPDYLRVSNLIQRHLHAMLKGDTTPDQCLEALKHDLSELS